MGLRVGSHPQIQHSSPPPGLGWASHCSQQGSKDVRATRRGGEGGLVSVFMVVV